MSNHAHECIGISEAWAREEFGGARLGNEKRTNRAVLMASCAAEHPSGIVAEVFTDPAALEGAYRFVRNPNVDHRALGQACYEATARRCTGEPFVFVPTDGSNVVAPWASGTDEFGPVGTSQQKVRGVETMTCIAVTPGGTPLGLAGQQWWVRPNAKKDGARRKKPSNKPRPLHKKETQHWLRCIETAQRSFAAAGVTTPLWFQLDAGGDFREMLRWMIETDHFVTVRAAQDRRVLSDEDDEAHYLWQTVEAAPCLGSYELEIPGGSKRKREKRTARIELRTAQVTIRLYNSWSKTQDKVTLTAVLAREVGTVPADEKPIEWLLLTNRSVTSFEDARLVVYGYSLRWKIEEFHRTWKSICRVEDAQLRTPENLITWATILAAVAMRIERLTYLARERPNAPATEELTRLELDALIVLRKPAGYRRGDIPTIGEAVQWLARLGGYRGKSSGGPPGAGILGRALVKLATAAQVLANLEEGEL